MSHRRGTIPLWDSHKKMPTINIVHMVVTSKSKPMFIVHEQVGLYGEEDVHRYYNKEQMDFQIGRKIKKAESSRTTTFGKYEFTSYRLSNGEYITVYDIESYEYFNRKYVKKEQPQKCKEPTTTITVVNNLLENADIIKYLNKNVNKK
jgi:hypothetical protein